MGANSSQSVQPVVPEAVDAVTMNEEDMEETIHRNYLRNSKLIDLRQIPEDIQTKVLESYHNQTVKGRDKLFNYFIANKLKNLMEHISEF